VAPPGAALSSGVPWGETRTIVSVGPLARVWDLAPRSGFGTVHVVDTNAGTDAGTLRLTVGECHPGVVVW